MAMERYWSTEKQEWIYPTWRIEYDNDTGFSDEGFWEWWTVTDGTRAFRADTETDAEWLCKLLNEGAARL
jgi:hypothetical protein